jgi:hypothetical protein
MSTWRVGADVASLPDRARRDLPPDFGPPTGEPTAPPAPEQAEADGVKVVIDRLTKWIPGDVLALYVAAVTAFAAAEGARPSPVLLVVFIVLSAAFVVGSTFAASGEVPQTVILPAILAAVAFTIWTLTVPFSGWQRWSAVSDNQAAVAVVAAVAGALFGFVADGLIKRAARR